MLRLAKTRGCTVMTTLDATVSRDVDKTGITCRLSDTITSHEAGYCYIKTGGEGGVGGAVDDVVVVAVETLLERCRDDGQCCSLY